MPKALEGVKPKKHTLSKVDLEACHPLLTAPH
jgi:hypothetical protein